MALAAVADTRRNSEIHLCSPTFQRCLTDLRSTFRFSEKREPMFSSRFLIRKLASLLSGRRRSTAFASLVSGLQRDHLCNVPGPCLVLNNLILLFAVTQKHFSSLMFFFSIDACSFCKNDTLPWEVLWRKPAEPGQQWNSGKSGIIGGFFFPFSETKNRNLPAQRQRVSSNDKLVHSK